MKSSAKKVIETFDLPTANRGVRTFIISVDSKGYFAHELGDLTQWGKVFNTGERKAHRINPIRKHGNRYGRFWRPAPFNSFHTARIAAQIQSKQTLLFF